MIRVQAKFPFKWKIRSVGLQVMVLGFLAVACMPDKPPSGILNEQEMVKIITEIYLAEAKAARLGISRDSIKEIFPQFEAKVFDKVGVPDSVFQKSMKYYLENPKKLEFIYTALVDSLNLKSQSVAPEKEAIEKEEVQAE